LIAANAVEAGNSRASSTTSDRSWATAIRLDVLSVLWRLNS
jgi:hypothetical protein